MCEKENNTKVQKPKISEITRWAFGFAISQTFLIIFPIFSHILGFDFDPVLCLIMALLFAPISFVLGVIGVFKIKKSKGRLKGLWFAIVGIVVAIITIALFICILIQIRKMAYLKMCENNLSGLGKAISVYAQDNNGKYPLAESWCDLLVEHTDVTEGYFVCKGGGKGRGYYAMNPNCEPNSPNDVVFLFETKGGWNQYGGSELLNLDNHFGKGCSIFFRNGELEFVRTKELGGLNWGGGEKAE